MALRLKNHWFKAQTPKSAAQQASAIGFIIWRVSRNMLDQMRKAGFDIDIGPTYFAFMREVLVFLVQVADRLAFAQLPAEERHQFTTALALRMADFVEENQGDLLGPLAPGADSHRNQFIDQFNALSSDYAEFGYGADGPDFGFMRYLGSRIMLLLPDKDQHWVGDQVIAIEAPEAAELIRRSMEGVFSTEAARPRRKTMSGE